MSTFQKAVVYGVSTFAVLVSLLNNSARAQGPIYTPGKTIKIAVTFEGPDAGRIKQVQMYLSTKDADPSQPGFLADIGGGTSERVGNTNTFEVSWPVKENQASGDYSLYQLNVMLGEGNQFTIVYRSPADFPVRMFKINNPGTLVKPTIKDVKELR